MARTGTRRTSGNVGQGAAGAHATAMGGAGAAFSSFLGRLDRRGKVSHGPRRGPFSELYLPQLIPAVLLVIYGAIVIWSASLTIAEASFPRHLMGIAIGAVAAYLMWRYDYRSLENMSRALLIADIILMLLPSVPGLSYSALGMTGWIQIPFVHMTFQPSELAKLVTIFLMASLGAEYNGNVDTLRDYVRLCAYLMVPFILIMTQPDLGTGLIILVTGAAIIIVSGARKTWVIATIALIVVGATLIVVLSLTPGVWHPLKQYQLNRLIVFVDPSVDPSGDGYNLQQAKIAVGSGGLLGKGIGNASQAGSGFLPEAHTDFVFALLSEEFGFVGAVVLLGLFGWMIFATITLAERSDSPFAKLVLTGVVTMWSFQVLQNVGMCIGIMPITGIPLPFISFGSSSMLAQMLSIGVVQSVWHHRKKAG